MSYLDVSGLIRLVDEDEAGNEDVDSEDADAILETVPSGVLAKGGFCSK